MKNKLLLGVSLFGILLGMTGCGDNVSTSEGDSSNEPSAPSSTMPSETPSTTPSVAPSETPSTNPSVEPSIPPSTSSSVGGNSSDNSGNNSTSAELPPVPNFVILGVNTKSSFRTFNENKMEKPTNRQTEFSDLTREYVVGDDNSINVKPEVIFGDPLTRLPVDVEKWNYSIEVYIKSANDFVLLGEEDLKTYVDSIDSEECDIDFSEAAIGNVFKVVVTPDGLSNNQMQNEKNHPSMIFEIVDGYNVYNAKELAYYDNSDENKAAWTQFKADNGLDLALNPSSLILHDNIPVKTEDVPSNYFYNVDDEDFSKDAQDYERTVGSLRDRIDVYYRLFSKDEKFVIYGNYYTLNFSEFPYVTRESGKVTDPGKVISHANLFKSEARAGTEAEDATRLFTMRDLNLIGNAPKQENTILGGGLIMNKSTNMEALMENNISRMWFITYFSEMDGYTINKCKAYDNFNSFIYNWGGNVHTSNSELIGAGGPVILQDHIKHDSNGEGGYVGKSTFTNCKMESVVAGTEGWFSLVGAAALAPVIKSLNDIFKVNGANFVFDKNDAKMFNLISVNKSGNAQTVTPGVKIKGSVRIDDNPAFDFGATNPYLEGFINNVTSFSNEAPIFQSTGGDTAFAYFNGSNLIGMTQEPVTADHPIFKGDYLCIYYMGMCFSFGYYH
ncbi:MAG: hypothetical protein J1F31_01190 [Erysipelotrichales bacterium]|nr:hypothetical protein [Erysipelotrichales bacterium]